LKGNDRVLVVRIARESSFPSASDSTQYRKMGCNAEKTFISFMGVV